MSKDHAPSRRIRTYGFSSRFSVLTVLVLTFLYAFHFPAFHAVNPSHGQCLAGTEPSSSKSEKPSDTAQAKSDPRVTVYVTSWCPACTMTIGYLKKKNIPFTVKDIEKNPDYMKEMIKKSGSYRGVPVLDIDGKTYLGFHPSIIDDLEKK
jgi:glutaredoxin 3